MNRSYQEKEAQLQDALKRKEDKVDELYGKLRALKRYARQLKYLGEDLSPIGQPLADILTQQPPVSLEEEGAQEAMRDSRAGSELSRLRKRNAQLEKNVQELADVQSVHRSRDQSSEVDNLRR